MGRYIEVPEPKRKVQQLEELYNALVLDNCPKYFSDVPADTALLCVVDNGPFEAAAYVYDEVEFRAFKPTAEDFRPRKWLLLEKDLVESLC